MTKYNAHDDFFYPNTDIPKNKLKINDIELLEELEKQSLDRVYEVFLLEYPPIFTCKYIKQMHIEIFGKLYTWAGQYRNVDMSKGNTHFANCRFIPQLMKEWEALLLKIGECSSDRAGFAEFLARISIEFNAIHPYREGNGRVIRFVLDQMAVQNGYETIWGNVIYNDKFKKKYIQASEIGVTKKDYGPMKDIIINNLISS